MTTSANLALATARRIAHHLAQLDRIYEIYLYGPVACGSPGPVRLILTVEEIYFSKYLCSLANHRSYQPDVSPATRRFNEASDTLGWSREPLMPLLGTAEIDVILVPIDWQDRLDSINRDLHLDELPLTREGIAAARWFDRSLGHFRTADFNAPPPELHPTQSRMRF